MQWQVVWSSVLGSAFGTLGSLLVAWVTSRLSRTAATEQTAADRARELHAAVAEGEMRPDSARRAIRLLRVPAPRVLRTRRAQRVNAPLDAWLDALDERRFPPDRADEYPEYEDHGEGDGQ